MRLLVNFTLLILISIQSWAQKEQLIVFTDSENKGPVLTDFNNNYLAELQKLSTDLKLDFKKMEAKDGLPPEVTSLPSIYYINNGKKILYKGRYGTLDRIKSFISNQRTFGFEPTLLQKSNVFVQKINGFEIGINTKVTPIKKENPTTTGKDIYNEVITRLKLSFKELNFKDEFSFVEQSKLYYLNIYPYQATNGLYYFSYEIFSQHNCIEPIHQSFEIPFSGKSINKIVSTLALDFEDNLKSLLNDTKYKDGIELTPSIKSVNWSDLGIVLNAQNSEATKRINYIINSGTYKYSKTGAAPIAFTFPPPVSQYAGTIEKMSGEFSFDFSTLKGSFEVDLSSLDMGDKSLNESVQIEQLLIQQFPSATIAFEFPLSTVPVFEAIPIVAELSLMGLKTKQTISAEFKPISANEIIVTAIFSLDITNWSTLEKPDGPSPQKETVQVYANFKVVKK